MTDRVRERRRLRVWPAVVVLLVLVLIALALPIYEGKRHQQIAEKLEKLDVTQRKVYFSHYEFATIPHPSDSASYSGSGTILRSKSTLPEFVEKTGLSVFVRRIDRVELHYTINSSTGEDFYNTNLEEAFSYLKELGGLKSVSFHYTGVTQEQLTDLFNLVRVKHIDVSQEKLPKTRMPWLNHEGLTQLSVRRTNFSNPAIDDLPDSLEWLNAGRTRINDDGLGSFVRLKKLEWLNLSRTPTSKAAIEDLRKKMPWCKIEWEPLVKP